MVVRKERKMMPKKPREALPAVYSISTHYIKQASDSKLYEADLRVGDILRSHPGNAKDE